MQDDTNQEETFVPEKDDQDFLQNKLQIIINSCKSLDKKTAKEALAELKQKPWPLCIKENLNLIARHLLHSEFEEAQKVAGEMV